MPQCIIAATHKHIQTQSISPRDSCRGALEFAALGMTKVRVEHIGSIECLPIQIAVFASHKAIHTASCTACDCRGRSKGTPEILPIAPSATRRKWERRIRCDPRRHFLSDGEMLVHESKELGVAIRSLCQILERGAQGSYGYSGDT